MDTAVLNTLDLINIRTLHNDRNKAIILATFAIAPHPSMIRGAADHSTGVSSAAFQARASSLGIRPIMIDDAHCAGKNGPQRTCVP
jgi:hypothetical protein